MPAKVVDASVLPALAFGEPRSDETTGMLLSTVASFSAARGRLFRRPRSRLNVRPTLGAVDG